MSTEQSPIRPGGLTRRTFLGSGSLAALGAAGWRPRLFAAEGPQWDCIVLGAGIAGVTAARDLHQAGHTVLVVEGSQRIGGRMYTVRDFVRHPRYRSQAARFPLEAGAEYVHIGDKKRYGEFFDELDRHGFVRRKFPKFKRNRLAFPDWKKNPKRLLLSLLRNTNLIPTVTLLSEVDDYNRAQDIAAGAYVAGKGYKGKGLRLARYTLSSHTPGLLYDPAIDVFHPPGDGAIMSCEREGNGVADTISVAGIQADELPKQLFYELSEFKMERPASDGGSEACPYDSLPMAIADELRDASLNPRGSAGEIWLGHRVERVERRGDGVAVVVTTPGGETRELLAKSALCTFSVGMLDPARGEGDRIFGELLTDPKREALKSIRMGPITKFSVELKKSYWGRKAKMTVMSHPTGCARTFFSAFPGHRRGPFVLTGLLMNQDHEIIRSLDDGAAVQHVLDVLQSVLAPRKPSWTPEEVMVMRDDGTPSFNRQDWEADEFARGGNSYIGFRSEVDTAGVRGLREALRDPTASLPLFWAGEATAPAYNRKYQPLSVHGAYVSGKGAARDVAEFLSAGASRETFRESFERKRDVAAAEVAAAEAAGITEVALSERDLAALQGYADRHAEGDLDAAANRLLKMGLYLQEGQPKRLGGSPPSRPAQTLALGLNAEEAQRVEAWAQLYTGGDENRAIRALLQRALAASL